MGFVAEEDAVFCVESDGIKAKEVIGILVADGYSESSVCFECVVLEEAVTDAPA